MEQPASTTPSVLIPGTPESFWATLDAPAWSPPALPLIVVAPHPDDETLGAGGLIYTWASVHHIPVTIISVTDGEAARPEVAGLADIRRRELDAARHDLAPEGIDVIRLQLPDGQVTEYSDALMTAIDRNTPDGATIIAPFAQDGHPDHNAAGNAAIQVAQRRGLAIAQYPIWAWHQTTPAIFNDRRLGRFDLTPSARQAKQNAIHRFDSQLSDRPGGAIVPAYVLEYFSRPYEMFVLT
jgi:LmbE family N-acetylglucosaminyl deacetylase